MYRWTYQIVAWIAGVVFAVNSAWAAEAEKETGAYHLDEIRVISSPIIEGNVVDRYGSQKSLVSEEQIEQLNAQDMTTALRKTPGVTISRYNTVGSFGGGEGGAIFIRGMGSSRPGSEIKVFIDGIPMYMSIWNHPLMDLMSIDTAAQVEVFKSPQPQNFGNAVGAINIVPKQKKTDGVESKIRLAAGRYDTLISTLESGGRFDALDYYVGGGYRTSDGHRDHAGGDTGDAFARVGYRLNSIWSMALFGFHTDNSAEDPGMEGADPAEREGTYETRATLASLTFSNTYDAARGYVKLYMNQGEGDWLDQPTSTPGVTEDLYNDFSFYGIKVRETWHGWQGGEILVGADWDHVEGEYDAEYSDGTKAPWDGDDFSLLSPYAAVSHQWVSEGLSLIPSAGVRYYDNSIFGEAWAPHAGIILGIDALSFHAGYSRGVVFPGLDVIVFSQEVIPPLGETWKDLDPERMDHYETGISYTLGRKAKADLTWFYNDGKDRYVFVPGSPPYYDNVETYVTKGVEGSVSVNPLHGLSLFFGVTYLDADPFDLPYAPETTYSAGVSFRFFNAFTLDLDAQYVNDMYVSSQARRATAENSEQVDDYTLVNGKLSYGFKLGSSGVSGKLFVAVENLMDTDYAYRYGYPMPGISPMGGINLTF